LGAEGLVYLVQNPRFRLHLNGGILYHNEEDVSVRTIDRKWDWNAGFGVDLPISGNVELVGDLNWYHPFNVPAGFDATRVNEHSLQQSLLMGGLLWRF
jgi:hypothetical protein